MTKNSNILVSTTSTLEGISIESYLKPVSAHIVVGANALSDIMASFTDFFGGYSDSLQKRLSLIYEDGLKAIREKAGNIGADAVIGLSVDLDEISGKGKSMFMVTVIGTAVRIKFNDQSKLNTTKVLSSEISGKEMAFLLKKKLLLAEISSYKHLDSSIWDFVIENSVYEVFEIMINAASKELEGTSSIYDKAKAYLQNIPDDIAAVKLYKAYLDKGNSNISSLLFDVIKSRGIRDYKLLSSLLCEKEIPSKEKVLKLANINNFNYKSEDIESIQILHDLIKEKYPIKVEFSTRKKMLSNKEEDIWICSCKTKNQIENKYCTYCELDIYGFKKGYPNIEDLLKRLLDTIEILKSTLS